MASSFHQDSKPQTEQHATHIQTKHQQSTPTTITATKKKKKDIHDRSTYESNTEEYRKQQGQYDKVDDRELAHAETIDILATMLMQEATTYAIHGWLDNSEGKEDDDYDNCILLESYDPQGHQPPVDEECRARIGAWYQHVIEACGLNHETVEIAMSCLDRFLATEEGLTTRRNRASYRLASMTMLYTTIKAHEAVAMKPTVVAALSQGAFSAKDVERMEQHMLSALNWRINPPTTLAFIDGMLDLLPEHTLSQQERQTIVDLSIVQTQTAVHDYHLAKLPASLKACAALMNSMESLHVQDVKIEMVACAIANVLHIDSHDAQLTTIQDDLYYSVHRPRMTSETHTTGRKDCCYDDDKDSSRNLPPSECNKFTSTAGIRTPYNPRVTTPEPSRS